MKNILFIINNTKISPNVNGGASVYYSHVELLYKAGVSLIVLALQWDEKNSFNIADFKEVESMVKKIIPLKIHKEKTKKGLKHLLNAVLYPEFFEYNFLNRPNQSALQKIIAKENINLIWSEWRWAGILTGFAKFDLPVVYAHHDWEYKLGKLRKRQNLIEKFHTFQKKRVEQRLVKKVSACISGSYTEADEIRELGQKNVLYLPTTYAPVDTILPVREKNKIVHLGGMSTTANRIGLERFLDISWGKIKSDNPGITLEVIGNVNNISTAFQRKLNDPQINCLGFVPNLTQVLHPHDIHIIPWEFNTGTRTRLPVIFNHEQVLVAMNNSVIAFPEVKNGENSVLCNSLEEMAVKISELLKNNDDIYRLSKQGKQTFLSSYTTESQQQKINNLLEKIM